MFNIYLVIIAVTLTYFLAYSLLPHIVRRQQHRERALGHAAVGEIQWQGSYAAAFQRSLDVLGEMEAELMEADPHHGVILAKTPSSVWQWSSPVQISLQTHEDVTTILIEASSPLGLLDFGFSRRFICDFLHAWDCLPDLVYKE